MPLFVYLIFELHAEVMELHPHIAFQRPFNVVLYGFAPLAFHNVKYHGLEVGDCHGSGGEGGNGFASCSSSFIIKLLLQSVGQLLCLFAFNEAFRIVKPSDIGSYGILVLLGYRLVLGLWPFVYG